MSKLYLFKYIRFTGDIGELWTQKEHYKYKIKLDYICLFLLAINESWSTVYLKRLKQIIWFCFFFYLCFTYLLFCAPQCHVKHL